MKRFKILTLMLLLMVGVLCFSACKDHDECYEVLSNSMAPTIETGDMVKIKTKDSYALGDIIMFTTNNLPVVHRVICVFEEDDVVYYVCHGDNVQNVDGTITNPGEWLDDAVFLQNLVNNASTKQDIIEECVNIQIITNSQIQGYVYEIIKK